MDNTDILLPTLEVAKFYYIFGLYGNLSMEFVKSILTKVYIEGCSLTDKQKQSLANSVEKLRMREKLSAYDLRGAMCYFNEEIECDTDEDTLVCCATHNEIGTGNVIIKNAEIYSVEAFMEASKLETKPKQTKQKIKLNTLIKKD